MKNQYLIIIIVIAIIAYFFLSKKTEKTKKKETGTGTGTPSNLKPANIYIDRRGCEMMRKDEIGNDPIIQQTMVRQ